MKYSLTMLKRNKCISSLMLLAAFPALCVYGPSLQIEATSSEADDFDDLIRTDLTKKHPHAHHIEKKPIANTASDEIECDRIKLQSFGDRSNVDTEIQNSIDTSFKTELESKSYTLDIKSSSYIEFAGLDTDQRVVIDSKTEIPVSNIDVTNQVANTENEKVDSGSTVHETLNIESSSTNDQYNVESVDESIAEIEREIVSDGSNSPTFLHKWPCTRFNATAIDWKSKVVLMKKEEDVFNMFQKMNESNGCALVMYYSPYCEFSVEMAPLYNMIGRNYPDLAVLSVDAQESMSMSARYGIVGIPTVLLFYSGRAVAKFNRSRTVEDFALFIKDHTGFTATGTLEITDEDGQGPMPTIVIERTALHLAIAIAFLITFCIYHLFGSSFLDTVHYIWTEVKTLFVHEKIE